MICDAVTHHPIDLLPDREADTLADWLSDHPEVTHVTRDRYSRFQEVISAHSAEIIQIHDRFHLIQNLWALHNQIIQKILPARIDLGTPLPKPDPPPGTQTKADIRQTENARKKWEQAQVLQRYYTKGYSITRLSKQFNLNPRTVKRYLEMTGPPDTSRKKRPKALDAFHKQVIEWEAAGHSIHIIYKKLQDIGYEGAYGSVKVFVAQLRKKKRAGAPWENAYHNRRDIRRMLWQNNLSDERERDIINRVLKQYPTIQPVYAFIASFRDTIARRDQTGFVELILYEQIREDPLTGHFIRRLLSDLKPTLNAITYTESNGFVEGNVNRLKTVKRMMYGRAGFELLRQRMLYRPA
ncbi:transposase [Lacicoccus alkaliphilus]|uniref:transposase n=1 Tax=Lacicoccus alkaliphilus TaxID=148453 RepID=UPI001FE9CDCA